MALSVSISFPSDPQPSPQYIGWRGLHSIEGGREPAYAGAPAVLPPIDTYALPMNDSIQRMSFELMRYFAPVIDGRKWRAAHGYAVAMNNGSQNGFDGGRAHADYINQRDLLEGLPRYDKMQRNFSGTFIRGDVVGDELICRPGIHGIDARGSMPDIETIVRNNWYVMACTSGQRIYNFPHGEGSPTVYPFIFDRPIRFPLHWFMRWEEDYLPDHLTPYNIL